MALSSMTGFARGQGVAGSYAWSWELKSVNAKGLDLRLRLPPGWDAIEVPARARAAEKLARGTAHANLTVERKGVAPTVKVNEPVLNAVLATLKTLSGKVDAAKPTLDGILSLKGVIEVTEEDEREAHWRARKRPPATSRKRARRGWPSRWRRCFPPRNDSIPTACTRKRSCSPARPISARSSTALPPMSSKRRSCSPAAGRSAAGSIFWRRNSTANRIR